MTTVGKPLWQQVTALVSLSAGGTITGLSFVPRAPADLGSPSGMPVRLAALERLTQTPQRAAPADDAMLRSAIVNVAKYYLQLAKDKSPAEMEALIWQHDSIDGADHGESCAAFASLTLELGAQVVGQQSWVTGGTSYPWPLHKWADVRVDPNPDSLGIISIQQDAQAHHRWHPLGDGYQPQPGDWVLFDGHVEVVTGDSGGVLSTIGGDSLPNLSVNAHEYAGPLAEQGVAGFVDNGNLPGAASPAGAAQAGQPGQSAASGQSAGKGQSTGKGQSAGHGQSAGKGQSAGTGQSAGKGQSGSSAPSSGSGHSSRTNGQSGGSGQSRSNGQSGGTAQSGGTGQSGATGPGPAAGGQPGGSGSSPAIPGTGAAAAGPAAPASGSHTATPGTAPAGPGPGSGSQASQAVIPGTSDSAPAPSSGNGHQPQGRPSPAPASAGAHSPSAPAQQPAASAPAPADSAAIPGVPSAAPGSPAAQPVAQPAASAAPPAAPPASSTPASSGASAPSAPVIPGVPAASQSKGQQSPPDTNASPAAPGRDQQPPETGAPAGETSPQQAFVNAVAPGAMATQRAYGVPAAVTIAQAVLESGWGQSYLASKDHNLFGIKGQGPAGSDALPTQEFVNGQWVNGIALFRVYHNFTESIEDHGRLLATSSYYKRAMGDDHDPDAFANALTGVYATDPDYGAKLISLMQEFDLYRYDAAAATAPAPSAPARATPTPTSRVPASRTRAQQPPASRTPAPRTPASRTPASRTPVSRASGSAARTSRSRPAAASAAPAQAAAAYRPPVTAAAYRPAASAMFRPAVTTNAYRPAASAMFRPAAGGAFGSAAGAASHTSAAGAVYRPAMSGARRTTTRSSTASTTTTRSTARRAAAQARPATVYPHQIPLSVRNSFIALAKVPLTQAEDLYRDVAGLADIPWELLAACDWMQCAARSRYSPVHGEKLGTANPDGTVYHTKSEALEQCAFDLAELALAVYQIDLTACDDLTVRDLANVFAAFRWGGLLRRHHTSAMEFPYSVAGLTEQHLNMRWPSIDDPNTPDKPGARFRLPFGAVPIVIGLNYPAIAA